jgi:hypothetical protein
MKGFEYTALPARVVFGFDTLRRVIDENFARLVAVAPSWFPIPFTRAGLGDHRLA